MTKSKNYDLLLDEESQSQQDNSLRSKLYFTTKICHQSTKSALLTVNDIMCSKDRFQVSALVLRYFYVFCFCKSLCSASSFQALVWIRWSCTKQVSYLSKSKHTINVLNWQLLI